MSARLSAAQNEAENLEYREGRLHWSRESAVAAVGRAGVKADKHEGDGATPAGTYPLVSILYRPDRVAPPASQLPVQPLAPSDGWVDDPADANYNRQGKASRRQARALRDLASRQTMQFGNTGYSCSRLSRHCH